MSVTDIWTGFNFRYASYASCFSWEVPALAAWAGLPAHGIWERVAGRCTAEKRQGKQQKAEEKKKKKKEAASHKKQSLKKMMRQGCQLSSLEVADGNIKSFEKCARKYNVGYSLKKDKSLSPPRYFVFFKAKDVDVMTAAFREYTGKTLAKEARPSVLKFLAAVKERVTGGRQRTLRRSLTRYSRTTSPLRRRNGS